MMTQSKRIILAGIAMSLTASFPALAQDGKSSRSDPNAIRCKKLSVIGSLVRKERICKTNAEWKKTLEQQGRDADDLVTRSRAGMDCRPGNGC